jgi:hypothetical protein
MVKALLSDPIGKSIESSHRIVAPILIVRKSTAPSPLNEEP